MLNMNQKEVPETNKTTNTTKPEVKSPFSFVPSQHYENFNQKNGDDEKTIFKLVFKMNELSSNSDKIPGVVTEPPLNHIVFAIDCSTSMDENNCGNLELSKQLAGYAIDALVPGDKISIIPFTAKAQVLNGADSVTISQNAEEAKVQKQKLKEQLKKLEAKGGTNLNLAFEEIKNLTAFKEYFPKPKKDIESDSDSSEKEIKESKKNKVENTQQKKKLTTENVRVLFITDGDDEDVTAKKVKKILGELQEAFTYFTIQGIGVGKEINRKQLDLYALDRPIWTMVDGKSLLELTQGVIEFTQNTSFTMQIKFTVADTLIHEEHLGQIDTPKQLDKKGNVTTSLLPKGHTVVELKNKNLLDIINKYESLEENKKNNKKAQITITGVAGEHTSTFTTILPDHIKSQLNKLPYDLDAIISAISKEQAKILNKYDGDKESLQKVTKEMYQLKKSIPPSDKLFLDNKKDSSHIKKQTMLNTKINELDTSVTALESGDISKITGATTLANSNTTMLNKIPKQLEVLNTKYIESLGNKYNKKNEEKDTGNLNLSSSINIKKNDQKSEQKKNITPTSKTILSPNLKNSPNNETNKTYTTINKNLNKNLTSTDKQNIKKIATQFKQNNDSKIEKIIPNEPKKNESDVTNNNLNENLNQVNTNQTTQISIVNNVPVEEKKSIGDSEINNLKPNVQNFNTQNNMFQPPKPVDQQVDQKVITPNNTTNSNSNSEINPMMPQ